MKAVNNKSGKIYEIITMELVNCTNALEGQLMVLYKDSANKLYCREIVEFFEKFKIR